MPKPKARTQTTVRLAANSQLIDAGRRPRL
jgi:hypothetical protein